MMQESQIPAGAGEPVAFSRERCGGRLIAWDIRQGDRTRWTAVPVASMPVDDCGMAR
jgi:hypothetical protein